ncbi:uncharacterized protein LOC120348153 [Styela clava]
MAQAPAGLYSRLDQAVEPETGTTSPQPGQVISPPQQCRLCIVTLIIASTKKTYVYHERWTNNTQVSKIHYSITYASQGIWCGAIVIASGILGFKVRGKPFVCLYIANMIVSIVASCFMATLCIMSVICAGDIHPREGNGGIIAVHCILANIGFAGMIICIIHIGYCCTSVYCGKKLQGVVEYAAYPAYVQQQMVQLTNGQFIMIPAQRYVPGTSYNPGAHTLVHIRLLASNQQMKNKIKVI